MPKYALLAVMIATFTIVLSGLMYLNIYSPDHAYCSETRAYMALVMGATMGVVMLAFVLGVYSNRNANLAIFSGSAVVLAAGLYLVPSQDTVEDLAWMKAMISHHSTAILTSERAKITDPRVKTLADQIISSQRKEVDEMRTLIQEIENSRSGTSAS